MSGELSDDVHQGLGRALLIGHSYIKRLSLSFGFNEDVMNREDARRLATLMEVQYRFREVYVRSGELYMVSDLPSPEHISSWEMDYVVLDIGTNDIAQFQLRDPGLVTELATTVAQWADRLNVPTVVQATLPRIRNLACDLPTFRHNHMAYNDILRAKVDARTPSHMNRVRYNKMQGLLYPGFERYVHADGIHVEDPQGTYLKRVRKSLLGFY